MQCSNSYETYCSVRVRNAKCGPVRHNSPVPRPESYPLKGDPATPCHWSDIYHRDPTSRSGTHRWDEDKCWFPSKSPLAMIIDEEGLGINNFSSHVAEDIRDQCLQPPFIYEIVDVVDSSWWASFAFMLTGRAPDRTFSCVPRKAMEFVAEGRFADLVDSGNATQILAMTEAEPKPKVSSYCPDGGVYGCDFRMNGAYFKQPDKCYDTEEIERWGYAPDPRNCWSASAPLNCESFYLSTPSQALDGCTAWRDYRDVPYTAGSDALGDVGEKITSCETMHAMIEDQNYNIDMNGSRIKTNWPCLGCCAFETEQALEKVDQELKKIPRDPTEASKAIFAQPKRFLRTNIYAPRGDEDHDQVDWEVDNGKKRKERLQQALSKVLKWFDVCGEMFFTQSPAYDWNSFFGSDQIKIACEPGSLFCNDQGEIDYLEWVPWMLDLSRRWLSSHPEPQAQIGIRRMTRAFSEHGMKALADEDDHLFAATSLEPLMGALAAETDRSLYKADQSTNGLHAVPAFNQAFYNDRLNGLMDELDTMMDDFKAQEAQARQEALTEEILNAISASLAATLYVEKEKASQMKNVADAMVEAYTAEMELSLNQLKAAEEGQSVVEDKMKLTLQAFREALEAFKIQQMIELGVELLGASISLATDPGGALQDFMDVRTTVKGLSRKRKKKLEKELGVDPAKKGSEYMKKYIKRQKVLGWAKLQAKGRAGWMELLNNGKLKWKKHNLGFWSMLVSASASLVGGSGLCCCFDEGICDNLRGTAEFLDYKSLYCQTVRGSKRVNHPTCRMVKLIGDYSDARADCDKHSSRPESVCLLENADKNWWVPEADDDYIRDQAAINDAADQLSKNMLGEGFWQTMKTSAVSEMGVYLTGEMGGVVVAQHAQNYIAQSENLAAYGRQYSRAANKYIATTHKLGIALAQQEAAIKIGEAVAVAEKKTPRSRPPFRQAFQHQSIAVALTQIGGLLDQAYNDICLGLTYQVPQQFAICTSESQTEASSSFKALCAPYENIPTGMGGDRFLAGAYSMYMHETPFVGDLNGKPPSQYVSDYVQKFKLYQSVKAAVDAQLYSSANEIAAVFVGLKPWVPAQAKSTKEGVLQTSICNKTAVLAAPEDYTVVDAEECLKHSQLDVLPNGTLCAQFLGKTADIPDNYPLRPYITEEDWKAFKDPNSPRFGKLRFDLHPYDRPGWLATHGVLRGYGGTFVRGFMAYVPGAKQAKDEGGLVQVKLVPFGTSIQRYTKEDTCGTDDKCFFNLEFNPPTEKEYIWHPPAFKYYPFDSTSANWNCARLGLTGPHPVFSTISDICDSENPDEEFCPGGQRFQYCIADQIAREGGGHYFGVSASDAIPGFKDSQSPFNFPPLYGGWELQITSSESSSPLDLSDATEVIMELYFVGQTLDTSPTCKLEVVPVAASYCPPGCIPATAETRSILFGTFSATHADCPSDCIAA